MFAPENISREKKCPIEERYKCLLTIAENLFSRFSERYGENLDLSNANHLISFAALENWVELVQKAEKNAYGPTNQKPEDSFCSARYDIGNLVLRLHAQPLLEEYIKTHVLLLVCDDVASVASAFLDATYGRLYYNPPEAEYIFQKDRFCEALEYIEGDRFTADRIIEHILQINSDVVKTIESIGQESSTLVIHMASKENEPKNRDDCDLAAFLPTFPESWSDFGCAASNSSNANQQPLDPGNVVEMNMGDSLENPAKSFAGRVSLLDLPN